MNADWQSFEEEFRKGKPGDPFPAPGQPSQPSQQSPPQPQYQQAAAPPPEEAFQAPPEKGGAGSVIALAVVAIVGAAVIGGGAAFMLAQNKPDAKPNPFAPGAEEVEKIKEEVVDDDIKTIQVLIGNLTSPDDAVHDEAVAELVKIGKPAVPELIEQLEEKQEVRVYYATKVLLELGADSQDASEALIGVLDHRRQEISSNARECLTKIGAPAVPHLCTAVRNNGSSLKTRVYSLQILATIGPVTDEVVPTLVDSLSDEEQGIRDVATDAVGQLGKAAVPALLKGLDSDNTNMRYQSAKALSKVGADAAPGVEKLHKLLDDDQGKVRAAAADALGAIGPPQAEVASRDLVSMLRDDYRPARTSAGNALKKLGGSVTELLIKALDDPDVKQQETVGKILGSLGKPAVKPLTAALDNEKPQVRMWAAAALRDIGPDAAEALPILESMLKDKDDGIRYYAQQAIKRIKQ